MQHCSVFCVKSSQVAEKWGREKAREKGRIPGSFTETRWKCMADGMHKKEVIVGPICLYFPAVSANRPLWKTCALCTVIIITESQDRSSYFGLLTIVLLSLHFQLSSPRMHTQMHRWPFLTACLRKRMSLTYSRWKHLLFSCLLVQLSREYKTVRIGSVWVRHELLTSLATNRSICSDGKNSDTVRNMPAYCVCVCVCMYIYIYYIYVYICVFCDC